MAQGMIMRRGGAAAGGLPEFTYTGTYSLLDDGDGNWRIKFFTSGTLTFSKNATVDAFLVGGGASSSHFTNGGDKNGAGGCGYHSTINNIAIIRATNYSIVIGAGGILPGAGSSGIDGGLSSAFSYSAPGGYAPLGMAWQTGTPGVGGSTCYEFDGGSGSQYCYVSTVINNTGNGGSVFSSGSSGIVVIRNHGAAMQPKYGVRFSGSVSAGVRLYDAVGLKAGIGIGAAEAENDFDRIMPWAAMKRCNTAIVNGERVPTFYEGEAGFSNTAADVFVYVPLFFYHRSADDAKHVVSMQPLSGFVAPAKFRRADNSLRDYVFLPAYTSGLDANGVPVSRSGYYPHITSLNGWMSLLTTKHTALTLDADAWIEGTKDDEIKNILLDIEFATRDHQTFMLGASNMRYATDTATAGGTNQFTLPAATAAYYKIGQIIAIGTADKGEQIMSRGQITAIENGVITFEAMGGANVTVAEGNFISSRPWKSGACDDVKASSGAPANDGYYPCVYRGIENPWGNQYRWCWDYLQNNHAPSILLDPAKYAAGAISADYKPLSYTVPTANGYATEMGFDPDYPFARITKAVGGSSSTYFADYFYQDTGVRALRVGGNVPNGRDAGSRCFNMNASPSDAHWGIGAALSPA